MLNEYTVTNKVLLRTIMQVLASYRIRCVIQGMRRLGNGMQQNALYIDMLT
jgi:hypothetical protein